MQTSETVNWERNPKMSSSSKAFYDRSSAQDCMTSPDETLDIPEPVRRLRATLNPEPGQIRVFYSKAHDPDSDRAARLTHGVNTSFSVKASELVTPFPKTLFQAKLNERNESTYASLQRAPLGKSHDQTRGLPSSARSVTRVFGDSHKPEERAVEIINPQKTPQQVDEEYERGRELYRITHRNYRVGESVDRKYTWSSLGESTFGIETPHDNAGRHVKNTLQWNDAHEKSAKIILKRLDDFRQRTQPQLEQVHDPIKDTMSAAEDQAFGVTGNSDSYGAGDLIHARSMPTCQRGRDKQRGMLAAIRQQLKKANYHNFSSLMHAFKHYDKEGSGVIDMEGLQKVCCQFSLPLKPDMLESLLKWCDANNDGHIDYNEFANFLNWKDMMPSGLPDTQLTIPTLQKQIDKAIEDYRTSSSDINAVAGAVSTSGYRTYGVPTIRSDLPVPEVKKISETKNYGEGPGASGLINPTIFSNHGLITSDMVVPRCKSDIKQVAKNVLGMAEEKFEKMWGQSTTKHPDGLVSIESFRQILAENENQEKEKHL